MIINWILFIIFILSIMGIIWIIIKSKSIDNFYKQKPKIIIKDSKTKKIKDLLKVIIRKIKERENNLLNKK